MGSNKGRKAVPETEEQRRNREIVESIANNIASLARAMHSLLNGPLKKRALIVLLAQSSGLSQERVGKVIKALEELEGDWLNK
jgi:hypothetical protein